MSYLDSAAPPSVQAAPLQSPPHSSPTCPSSRCSPTVPAWHRQSGGTSRLRSACEERRRAGRGLWTCAPSGPRDSHAQSWLSPGGRVRACHGSRMRGQGTTWAASCPCVCWPGGPGGWGRGVTSPLGTLCLQSWGNATTTNYSYYYYYSNLPLLSSMSRLQPQQSIGPWPPASTNGQKGGLKVLLYQLWRNAAVCYNVLRGISLHLSTRQFRAEYQFRQMWAWVEAI